MSIVKAEITEASQKADGTLRVKFKYTLSDGRELFVGTVSAKNQDHANRLLDDKQGQALETIKARDAEEAVKLKIKTSYKEAGVERVQFNYLYKGFHSKNPIEAYEMMSVVADDILAMNLLVEDMAAMFNQSVESTQAALDKWSYLDANKNVILAYKEIEAAL